MVISFYDLLNTHVHKIFLRQIINKRKKIDSKFIYKGNITT